MIDMQLRIINNLRNAPSKSISLEELSSISCPCCKAKIYRVSRYPASKSRVFAGQLLLHCGICGVAFVPNRDLNLAEYYEEEYAKEFMSRRLVPVFYSSDNPIWSQPEKPVQRRAKFFSNLLLNKLGTIDSLLDYVAGEGFFLKSVYATNKMAIELDVRCQKILTEELGVVLVDDLGDVQDLDVIVSLRSLEHLMFTQVEQTLKDMLKALRPGGVLVLDVPNGAEQLSRFETGDLKPFEMLEPHTMFFSGYSLMLLLQDVGFKIQIASSKYDTTNESFNALRPITGETLMFICTKPEQP